MVGKSINVNQYDPHTVAGVLKIFLKELPEPLLTYELRTSFFAALGALSPWLLQFTIPHYPCSDEPTKAKKLAAVSAVMERLPVGNRLLAREICRLCHLIVANSEVNRKYL